MRPFITFLGLVLLIPGWTLARADLSDVVNINFSTPSGTVLWTLAGDPQDIGLIHQYGLVVIVIAITIVIYGLLASPGEQETAAAPIK